MSFLRKARGLREVPSFLPMIRASLALLIPMRRGKESEAPPSATRERVEKGVRM